MIFVFQAIAVSEVGYYVDGKILGGYFSFLQAGKVVIYNTTNGFLPEQWNQTLNGDRQYERFGAKTRVTYFYKILFIYDYYYSLF